jgi:hypothetical protein
MYPFTRRRGRVQSFPTLSGESTPATMTQRKELTRASSIRFMVHDGRNYKPVTVSQDMVGHKLGEFAHTRKKFTYKYAPPLSKLAEQQY